jgi:translation initiation factor IF-2
MAKIRVHEIAKEYDVTAKEVINFLHGHNIEVTNLSSLEDNAVSLIRGKYGKQDSTDDKKERPKKKASISAVYNPQNSKMGNRRPNNGNRNERNGDRPQRNNGDRPRNNNGDRPQRNNGDRPRYDGDRPQRNNGDRSRYDGERQQRNNGDRSRYDGDRQQRNNGDRPQRRFGDRPQRQENGDRNGRYERKDNNNQKGFQGNRGGGNSFGGNRNNRQDGQNRSRETRGRLDQEISRMNRDSAKAPIEELRGKENTHANKKKNKQDYERKNRKQEQYVNLEKKTGHKKRNAQPQPQAEKKADEVRSIALPEVMTIRELAERIDVPASKVVEKLFMQGILATVNQEIDYEKAEEIALEFNCIAEQEEKVDVIAELLKEEEEDENTLISRPPVVCVMGHVDHGKTSLLDAIRETHVTDREAGGITQHIGASVVKINGQKITFLDTPGHEAFTAMRMRGANATDIAILVVAADDGIMPQTVEAISHAKAAGIEIIVAINKIDKESANIDYVKQGLAEQGLIPEDWGGSTICVPVSARTGEGITELLEMVLLTADILELKANLKRNARGLVIEAQLDKGRGVVATVLVQKGTLKVGEPIAAGSSYGKVRAMIDDKGRRVKEAGPSTPVEILGLNNVPNAGEVFVACDSEKDARSFAETFVSQNREKMLEETRSRMSLDDLFSQIQTGNLKELELIVKADVQGSVEAVKQSLTKLSNEEVVVKVIHGGVGAINESDVSLASASNAIIIGFNVKPDMTAKATAEQEKVDIRLYSVIYKAIEDIEAAMKGMLDPIFEEKVIGHAEVRQIFKASGVGNIAGSYVLDGVFERNCKVRITREGKQIFEGDLASLKRFKDDVKEVKAGYECGLVFDGFNDIAEFDIVEAYKMVEVPR